MLKAVLAISSFCLLASTVAVASEEHPGEFEKWATVKNPTLGPAQVYGGYNAGCLAGASELPLVGSGFQVVRTSRNRFYGHPNLTYYVKDLGYRMKKATGLSIVVEDLSFPRGGPFYLGHASHQLGLDADISLQLISKKVGPSQSEAWHSPSYVNDRKYLKTNWKAEQVKLTSLAANSPYVNRIFVAPAIKKYFCDTNPKAPWLYKLRAWWGHDDHLHVRLNCPKDSPYCEPQSPLNSKGSGCGGELAWWYSAEADAQWEEMMKPTTPDNPPVKPYPKLPAQCEKLILEP